MLNCDYWVNDELGNVSRVRVEELINTSIEFDSYAIELPSRDQIVNLSKYPAIQNYGAFEVETFRAHGKIEEMASKKTLTPVGIKRGGSEHAC